VTRRWKQACVVGGGFVALVLLAIAWAMCRESIAIRWHLSRLESASSETRLSAARRLGELHSEEAVERLVAQLAESRGDPDGSVAASIVAMGEFAVPRLAAVLELEATAPGEHATEIETEAADDVLFVQLAVVEILRGLGPRAQSAVPSLAAIDHPYLVSSATQALAGMGERGEAGLERVLAHESINARLHAAQAFAGLYPEVAAELLGLATRVEGLDARARRRRVRQFLDDVRAARTAGR